VEWWKDGGSGDYGRARELLHAFSEIRSKDAVWPLVQSLGDVRLRPHIAQTLAAIGEEAARVPLVRAFAQERYQSARLAIARALVDLGAEAELAPPLVRFLGVPDPLPGGVGLAMRAGILEHVGGPGDRARSKLAEQSDLGVPWRSSPPRRRGRGVRPGVPAARVTSRSPVGAARCLQVTRKTAQKSRDLRESTQTSLRIGVGERAAAGNPCGRPPSGATRQTVSSWCSPI
jgi:hypothetical protein